MEVGSGGDQGQDIEVSVGHAHQLQGLGLGRTLQKIVGGIVGRRLELGANTYRVLVLPTVHHKPDSGRPRRPGPAPIRASEGLRAPVAMVARLEASPWAEVNVVAKLHRDLMSGSGLAGQHV